MMPVRPSAALWRGTGGERGDLAGSPSITVFLQAEDRIRDYKVTGVQTCALPIPIALGRQVQYEHPAGQVVDDDIARLQIGRASCRERGEISVVAVSLKRKDK